MEKYREFMHKRVLLERDGCGVVFVALYINYTSWELCGGSARYIIDKDMLVLKWMIISIRQSLKK